MVKQFFKERLGTIIFLAIVGLVVLLGKLKIDEAKSNAITFSEDYEAPEGNVDKSDEGTFVSIAKTDEAELFYNEARGTIQVKDLNTGYLWKGVVDEDVFELPKDNKTWLAYLTSPITITYNDLKNRDAAPNTVYAAKDCTWLESEYIDNGVAVTYGFLKPGIYVTVEYTIEDNQLVVRVPYEKIREESKFAITVLEVLPYLGACQNDLSGYMFYPDGSGAITTFEKASTRPANVKSAMYYTYTNRYFDFEKVDSEEAYERYTASMPVYGICHGNTAIFGVVTEGEAMSGISVNPSSKKLALNHIGFELYLRNVFNVNMYNMSDGSDSGVSGLSIQRVDKELIKENREIRYFMLNGEEANYSGMARQYREYLLSTGELKDTIADGEEMPLALSLLCGATKAGMVFEQYIPMTTFGQAQDISDKLQSLGVKNMQTLLRAWTRNGDYNNDYWPVAGSIGGTNALSDLNSYSDANGNNNYYLEWDSVFVYSETKGLSETDDVVYDGLDVEVAAHYYDGDIGYLINPAKAVERNNGFLKKLGTRKNIGIAYESIGMTAYPDYNENNTFTKTETANTWKGLLNDTSASGRNVAVHGSNQYVLSEADYLYELREDAFGLSITDYAVPFVEMVIGGYIPYSTEGAGNLAYDFQYQKMKWLEFGALPYFYLTAEPAIGLRETNHATLFSSTYADWEEEAVNAYKEIYEAVGDEYGKQIYSHEYITDDFVILTYEDGKAVYLNYGDASYTYNGVSVPARDYTVVRGGE